MPVVGLADETSERGRLCGISLVRSSRLPAVHHRASRSYDLPQGGVGAPVCLGGRRDVSVNLGACQLLASKAQMGGQKYLGARLRER